MGSSLLTPIALSETEKAGRRRFWKQILPVTSINYDGQKIDFNPQFHLDLADAFNKGAFEQVPLVFADGKNAHNMDPRNFGGDIIKTEYRGPGKNQGTWALIEADPQAARVIRRNPKLGVSARIKQGVEKADGRFFKRAINHVLLTMNPRLAGLSPWQAVDLAEDADVDVVDLTAVQYTEGNEMGKTATKGRRRQPQSQIDLSALSDDEFNDLVIDLAAMAQERGLEDPDLDDEDLDDDEEDEEEEPAPQARRRKSKVKTTKVVERESEGDDEDPDEDPDADLSERVMHRDEVSQFGQMRIDLAMRDWKNQRAGYLADGVPAFLLDLAEPILSQPDPVTIDLADEDGEDVDVRDTITQMLDGVKHVVDLGHEIGSSLDVDLSEDEKSEADALLDAWGENYSA